jgi:hypothetical protein
MDGGDSVICRSNKLGYSIGDGTESQSSKVLAPICAQITCLARKICKSEQTSRIHVGIEFVEEGTGAASGQNKNLAIVGNEQGYINLLAIADNA